MPPTATAEPPVKEPAAKKQKTPPKPKEHKPFEFAVPVRTVRDVTRLLKQVVVPRSTLEVLKCVHVERAGPFTRFTATDLDIALSYRIGTAEPEPSSELGRTLLNLKHGRENGSLLVESDPLAKLLKNLDDGELVFRCKDNAYSIGYPICGNQVNDARAVLEPDDFPPLPPLTSGATRDLGSPVRVALADALPFVSTDQTRYILNAVYLDTEHSAIVATDGRALFAAYLPINSGSEPLVIPVDTVKTLLSIWPGLQSQPALISHPSKDSVRFDTGPWSLTSKLVDGNYPNYRQVIPKPEDAKCEIELPYTVVSELLKAVPRLPKANDKMHDFVDISITPDASLWVSTLPDAFTKQNVKVARTPSRKVNIRLARDFVMRALKLGLRTWRLTDELSPITFSADADSRLMVAMPIRAA